MPKFVILNVSVNLVFSLITAMQYEDLTATMKYFKDHLKKLICQL